MRCYACDAPGQRLDQPTNRWYCNECFNIWMKTAYSEGFTDDEEDDTIQIWLSEYIKEELGLDVSRNTSDMS